MSVRILIVDDDPWILRMVATVLEKHGYEVFACTSAEEALNRVTAVKPQLIITDVMMPGLDGWGLVKKLRTRHDTSMIPVIFLTALSGAADKVQGFRLGADDYIVKPFRFEDLDTRVAASLKKGAEAMAEARAVGDLQKPSGAVKPPPVPGAVAGGPGKPPKSPPAKAAAVSGTLEQLGLSSLLVMIEMERKSGVLTLQRPGTTGRIFAREGRIIACRVGGDGAPTDAAKGEKAVYHLLTWAAGRFEFSAVEVDMQDEVNASTTHLLMEGARLIDEATRG